MQSQRRLEILRAIVDEYVATQEPVGSKAIADKTSLGISPATIRNEMAALEDEGDSQLGCDLFQSTSRVHLQLRRFNDAWARDQEERAVQTDVKVAELHG